MDREDYSAFFTVKMQKDTAVTRRKTVENALTRGAMQRNLKGIDKVIGINGEMFDKIF